MSNAFSHLSCLQDHQADEALSAAIVQQIHAKRTPVGGLDISIHLTPNTRILRSHDEKNALFQSMDFAEGSKCIDRLESIRRGEHPADTLTLNDFGFRHANGGVLPIVQTEHTSHTLLFHRDIHPEGWNIANGASATLEDLLYPEAVAIREATEELLFWDSADQLAITISDSQSIELAATLVLLGEDAGLLAGSTIPLELDRSGPDHLTVHLPDGRSHRTENTFLSFNLSDFGLECTWPAVLRPAPKLTPRDGELTPAGHLLNRMVGQFDLETLRGSAEEDVKIAAERAFVGGDEVESEVKAALCPVTRSIVERFFRR